MAIHTTAAAERRIGERGPTRIRELPVGGQNDRDAEPTASIPTAQFGRTSPNGVVQIIAVVMTILVMTAVAGLVTVSPWPFGFALAVASAVAWCVWLQRETG